MDMPFPRTQLRRFYDLIHRCITFCTGGIAYMVSFLSLGAALGAETLMHLLNIPHVEGWWIPIASGSTAVTGISSWFRTKYRKGKGNGDLPSCETAQKLPDSKRLAAGEGVA